jgi:hypothetical protein
MHENESTQEDLDIRTGVKAGEDNGQFGTGSATTGNSMGSGH